MSAMPPRAVLFDLDGTLIDSAPDLAAATNELLGRHGLPPLTLQQVIGMIGNGVRKLVERAFTASGKPLDAAALDAAYCEMTEIYDRHLTGLTTLMPGVRAALDALAKAGIPMALVTNKPTAASEAVLAHFSLRPFFASLWCGDSELPRKPAPDMLLAAAKALGAKPAETIMVGDGPADVESARAAGIRVVAIRGGYSSVPLEKLGPDIILDTLNGLPAALGLLPALPFRD